jgi:hypothetical protein
MMGTKSSAETIHIHIFRVASVIWQVAYHPDGCRQVPTIEILFAVNIVSSFGASRDIVIEFGRWRRKT